MIRPLTVTTCALVAATLLFACAFVKKELSPPPVPEQQLQAVPTPTPQPEPTPIPHKRRRRRHHIQRIGPLPPTTEEPAEASPEESPGATPTSTPAPSPKIGSTPSPTPTPTHVSIGDDTGNSSRVEGMVKQANGNLSNADPKSLDADDRAAYDQAKGLVRAAQKALGQGDYLAASSLAQKALLLSDRFAAGGATP